MDGKRTFQKIRLENFLSFGNEGMEIELQPLNVLIGPNAAGKSNFLETFRLFKGIADGDLSKVIREGGGIREYLWKGVPGDPVAKIEVVIKESQITPALSHRIGITAEGQLMSVTEEQIEISPSAGKNGQEAELVYRFPDDNRRGTLRVEAEHQGQPVARLQSDLVIGGNRSIIGLYRDPRRYRELAILESVFGRIQFARDLNLSGFGPVKVPQRTDLPSDVLWEDASNLGLILNNYPTKTKQQIVQYLKSVYDPIEEINTRVEGNTVQIFIEERGLASRTPAIRLSDGTLRYLCLLTLLNQPTLPSVLCLEEPEVGLHPDVIHTVADLLVEASRRVQIIVTTHSETLVSQLSEVSEAVIVCEREQNGTQLRRLQPAKLQEWLEDYSLGDLWRKGLLGGTRW